MAFAQGSRSRLSYKVESTFVNLPGTPFIELPYNTHSLNLSKERVTGNQIREDRMPRDDRHGNRQVGGDIVVDMRADDYDTLLEAAMFSTWDSAPVGPDELKVGTTPSFVSIEDYAADIDQSRFFTGCGVSSLAISIAPNQMVQATFGIVGKDMVISASEIATITAASGNAPFDAYSGTMAIGNVAASSASAIITSIDFTVENSLSPTFVIGSDSTPQLEFGMAAVEGSFTAYFDDEALINRFLNETESEIEVTVDDPTGANDYGFLFPKVKLNAADVSVDGPTSRLITIPFVALYDSTEATNLKITRPDTT